MCGRRGAGGRRASGGVAAGSVSGGGAAPRSGLTTVERESPVSGSMSSANPVVPAGGSAENAGEAHVTRTRKKIAVMRDMEKAAGSGKPHGGDDSRAPLAPGLYVVATPIGNLGDISSRALQALRGADFVAAEDTRNTRALLSHFGLSARLVALHEHNERASVAKVVDSVRAGKAVALVSDAGTPGVSDPGAVVVAGVREAGLPVFPVPGASALTAALSASGLQFEGVVFAGFLAAKGAARREKLEALARGPWAIVLFEAPHRVAQTLSDLHEALGDRDVVIARELTKRFETITRLPLAGARAWIEADADRRRGEFVLVIEGRPVAPAPAVDPEAVLRTLLAELPLKQAVGMAVKITGAKRNELYEKALKIKVERR